MSEEQLHRIAENDVFKLTPEGLQALREEVLKRELPLWFQIDDLIEDRNHFIQLVHRTAENLRDLPCPICGSEEYKLNYVTITTIIGKVFTTKITNQPILGCYNCVYNIKQEAEDTNSIYGWWSIEGLIETPKALKANDNAMKLMAIDEPTEELLNYAYILIMREREEEQRLDALTITIEKELQ
ncbi:hypothetical protein [Pedobacter flavus]|uniref:Uncharacterized protein n=1 Tax=Pedobacter flavus TaxID=3113906 RepID=A0ABU7GZ59_9SPHI|nr:hypothetical protein [Pedobacter sp. VNH31]MEE1884374.1 hypothetical protein [Pedobacter sp. VNH31]